MDLRGECEDASFVDGARGEDWRDLEELVGVHGVWRGEAFSRSDHERVRR